jgi:hypothetical protein
MPGFPIVRRRVWQLRSRRCFTVLETAFFEGCRRLQSRLCHSPPNTTTSTSSSRPRTRSPSPGPAGAGDPHGPRAEPRDGAPQGGLCRSVPRALAAHAHRGQAGEAARRLDRPYSSAVATGPPPARVLVAPPTTWLLMTGYLRAWGHAQRRDAVGTFTERPGPAGRHARGRPVLGGCPRRARRAQDLPRPRKCPFVKPSARCSCPKAL